VVDPSAIAALVSAVVNGLTLLLNEIRQRKNGETSNERVRVALLELEGYLEAWAWEAEVTNGLARSWATQLPNSAGEALEGFLDSAAGQSMYSAEVESLLGRQVGIIPPGFARDTSGQETLKSVLRIYAPEFFDLLAVFSRRKEQLLAMTAELERRHAEEGRESVEEYLSELDSAAEGLHNAQQSLARFIAKTFPLGSSGKGPTA
jgi:hypothetical protein